MSEPQLPPPPPPRRESRPDWRPPTSMESVQALESARPSGPGTPWTAARQRRPVRVWDLVLTMVLILCALGATLLLSYFGLFFAMASDACGGSNDCDGDLIGWGVLVAAGGVWVPFLAAVAVSIVLLVVRRIAFWVPIAGLALSFGCTVLGGWMATVGSGT
ncbi:DUF6264 family protein [Rathayibacter sp. VKM Ac-2927]|uniref:DUF6264 family protein n=1 Tax=Rathayibacter sp. VKM Ac-2927 TaxID=2929478 RepID=UPI001FB517DD|nr:DUF6264 family protein [Rathayibacter sp. VKM Ac-2927]MCJ1686884.1 DUF6264 family protein [Rathayibacter sp. VKM Ac-2927]